MAKRRGTRDPVNVLFGWMRRQSMKVKTFLALVSVISSLLAMKLLFKDTSHFFIASEASHAAGIMVTRENSCFGLSLKSQEITAIFLAVRLYCSTVMELHIHTVLDFATLVSTLWVIYMIRFKLKSSYMKDLDSFPIYYLVIPSAFLALIFHPGRFMLKRVMWAFCVYLESVSVLPQLRLMQNAKMVEPFTGHYVFALGIARFFGCALWIIKCF